MLTEIGRKQWTVITPKGVKRSAKSLGEWKYELRKNAHQLSCMIGFQKKRLGFGQALGTFWLFLDPMLQTALYYFIVTVLSGSADTQQLLKIAVAVAFWRFHATVISQSVNLFRNNIELLSQIYFPLRLILMEFVLVNIYYFAYALVGPLLLLLANGVLPQASWLWVFPLFALQTMFTLAIAVFLSVAGTYIRDISGIIFLPMAIWWYLSPGIYDVNRVPQEYRWLFDLNPFAYFFNGYHNALLFGSAPDRFFPLLVIFVCSAAALALGGKLLVNARYHFFKYL